jgi:hypothetical protein
VDRFSEKRDGKSKTYGFPQTDDNTPLGGVIPLRGRRGKGFPVTPVKSKG